jgi:hypothetical protein
MRRLSAMPSHASAALPQNRTVAPEAVFAYDGFDPPCGSTGGAWRNSVPGDGPPRLRQLRLGWTRRRGQRHTPYNVDQGETHLSSADVTHVVLGAGHRRVVSLVVGTATA